MDVAAYLELIGGMAVGGRKTEEAPVPVVLNNSGVGKPDTIPNFAYEAQRQSRLVAESPQELEDQAFVDAISI